MSPALPDHLTPAVPRRRAGSRWRAALTGAALALVATQAAAGSILFIGNSFTYGQGSAVHYWRAGTVTDLNDEGVGGLPALFKSFTVQAGIDEDVYLETHGGVGLDWHLEHKAGVLGARPWDAVVMHGLSTLDASRPGDPALLVDTVHRMAALLRRRNPAVEIRLLATWPRADQTDEPSGAWHGKPIAAMAHDVRAGYDKAQAATPGLRPVIPVGDAWLRAMRTGVADPDPYDGTAFGQVDLWTWDHYHASTFGYYLEALVVFGSVTGRDPRSLGDAECSGYELGLSRAQVTALQQVAYDELAVDHAVEPAPAAPGPAGHPARCGEGR